jgi:hypothetical protein
VKKKTNEKWPAIQQIRWKMSQVFALAEGNSEVREVNGLRSLGPATVTTTLEAKKKRFFYGAYPQHVASSSRLISPTTGEILTDVQ